MVKGILGVIVGYLVLAGFLFTSFTAACLAMGADRAFEPGTYDVSTLWIVVSFVLSFVAAWIGGCVCRAISGGRTAALVLALLILVAGMAMALPAINAPADARPGPRTGDVSNLEAMKSAQTPPGVALANPIVGLVGVLLGARRKEAPMASPVTTGGTAS